MTAEMISKWRSLWKVQFKELILVRHFCSHSNAITPHRKTTEEGVIPTCPGCLALSRIFLGVPRTHSKTFDSLIQSYGLVKTVETLQRAKTVLDSEGLDLSLTFGQKGQRKRDAVKFSRELLMASQHQGVKKTMAMLKSNPAQITHLSNWITTKKQLERLLGIKGINPGQALMKEATISEDTVYRKVVKLKQVIPDWCIKRLVEGNSTVWFTHTIRRMRDSLKIIEEAFKSAMSTKTAKEGSLVCIIRCPRILDSTTVELKKKIDRVKNSVLGESFGDYILRYPAVLSPLSDADLDVRYRQLTAWSSAAFWEMKQERIASLGGLYMLYSKQHTRTVERLQFVATMGADTSALPLSYFSCKRYEEFEELHPGFRKWKAVFIDAKEADETFLTELRNQMEATFDEIDVRRFQRKYPVFSEAISALDTAEAALRVRCLLSYFGSNALQEVTRASTVKALMAVSSDRIRTAFSKLCPELNLKRYGISRLLVSFPEIMISSEICDEYRKKLRVFSEYCDDLDEVLKGDLSIMRTPLKSVLFRHKQIKKTQRKSTPIEVFTFNKKNFSMFLKYKINPPFTNNPSLEDESLQQISC